MRLEHTPIVLSFFAITSVLAGCPDDAPSRDVAADTSDVSDISDTSDTYDSTDTRVEPDTRTEIDVIDTDVGPFVWPWPLSSIDVPADPSWKARVTFPDDPLLADATSYDPPSPRWVKFTVLTGDPTRVFFQDSKALTFHYDFGSLHLPPLVGLDHAAFDAATLVNPDRKAILGAVLFAPSTFAGPVENEVGIQLAANDPLDPRVVTAVLELVAAAIDSDVPLTTFYMPTYEQADAARPYADYFAQQGFPLGSAERWSNGDVCYVRGWAVGRLVEVAPSAIRAAWEAGELTPSDILVTDQVPAEVPPVAGIITRQPSTPASHVAILASTFEIPFVFVATDASRTAINAHLGQLVALRASDRYNVTTSVRCTLEVASAEAIPEVDRVALSDLKRPPALVIPPRVSPNVLAVAASTLTRDDVKSYGGKAANFSILRSAIPEASPNPAIAFSFDLFDHLMARPAPGAPSTTLGQAIDARLAGYSWPPDMRALAGDLAAVRDLVKATTFAPGDMSAIKTALAVFDPERNIRFRSSTNVEDTATFTGAGLYDSYSGCLHDDIDSDEAGPSVCDPSESNERGVLRALAKVYASFWNDNAFLARLERRVPAAAVAMGVLAHHSYPDANELANGVAVVSDSGFSRDHSYTTQLGAVSVTNPEGSAQPEVVRASVYDSSTYLSFVQASSLVPLGDHVMAWEADYIALSGLLERVANAWRKTVPADSQFALDLEFKKVLLPNATTPSLEIKQVRPLPQPDRTTELTSYLLPAASARLCTFQGESGSLFGNHRGKMIVTLTHRPTFLDAANREAGFYTQLDLELMGGVHVAGAPASLPAAFHAAPIRDQYSWSPRVDGFVLADPESPTGNTIEYAINTEMAWLVTAPDVPLRTIDDARLNVTIEYDKPRYDPDYWDGDQTPSDYVLLGTCPDDVVITPAHPVVQREALSGDVSVDIRFWYPPTPTGATAGYTAWLAKWDRTVITGLTRSPIELHGYWSQTFRPGHHNFEEAFLFEPGLEPGISDTTLAELAAQDIRLVFVRVGYLEGEVQVVGADGRLRALTLALTP